MNTNTQIGKIDKVLSKISGKELKAFAHLYACTHDDFATALVEKYWKPERGNYREMVEACFAHADILGKRYGQAELDWREIEKDLAAVMRKAKSMKKKGNLIDAALIAGYVMTITCREFEHDHQDFKPLRYDLWAEENKVLKCIVIQSADMVSDLLISNDVIEEDSRFGMLQEIVDQCEEIGDNYFMRFEWFVDEAMPLLCVDDEKRFEFMKDMFVHKEWDLWDVYKKFVKFVPKKDLPFVGETMFNDIKRMALLKEKTKEFAWLMAYVKSYMGLSAVVDRTIKEGIKQLIAEYPDKFYFKSYLGSLL